MVNLIPFPNRQRATSPRRTMSKYWLSERSLMVSDLPMRKLTCRERAEADPVSAELQQRGGCGSGPGHPSMSYQELGECSFSRKGTLTRVLRERERGGEIGRSGRKEKPPWWSWVGGELWGRGDRQAPGEGFERATVGEGGGIISCVLLCSLSQQVRCGRDACPPRDLCASACFAGDPGEPERVTRAGSKHILFWPRSSRRT